MEQLDSDGDARELLREITLTTLSMQEKSKSNTKAKSKGYVQDGDAVLGRVAEGGVNYKKR